MSYTKADQYMIDNINNILENGYIDENPRPRYSDGTPAHTKSVNHVVRQYDLNKGEFPILTLRPIAWKGAIKEVLWIYQDASSDLDILRNRYNNHIWDAWDVGDNTIGYRYGHTVGRYSLMDRLLDGLKRDPFGRRHVVDLWQEEEFADECIGLKPCAFCTIWNVRKKDGEYYLDMLLTQRSGDMITASGAGGWNEVQYAALLMMVAKHCGYRPGVFTHVVANEQIYDRHETAAYELLRRYGDSSVRVREETRKNMDLQLSFHPASDNFWDFTIDDFDLIGYEPIRPQLSLDIGI